MKATRPARPQKRPLTGNRLKSNFLSGGHLIHLAAYLMTVTLAHAAGVVLENDTESATVKVTIGGEHFTTYHYGSQRHFPYLWPVNAEGGVGMTRNFPMGEDTPAVEDHPHHLSLYLAYGDLNGHDFWHVGRGRPGTIKTVDLQTGQGDGFGWIRAHHHWVAEEIIVMEEIRELRFHAGPPSARVFDFISTFKATQGDVTFGDTKEAMLAVRIRPEIDGTRGGTLTNAEGRQGEAKVYGTPSPWMDYSGTVAGHGTRGVAIFDHPENIRPGYWHVRDYGLASINPFGRRSVGGGVDGAHTLPNGTSLTLRYRFLVHSGHPEEAGIAAQHARYAADESVMNPIEINITPTGP